MMRCAIAVCVVLAAPALAAAAPAEDSWHGKERSEIVAALGPPSKAKRSANGEEMLLYRLVRVTQEDLGDPALTLLDVPGVGLVGRPAAEGDPFAGRTVSVEPHVIDERGHSSGGPTTTESRSISWSKDEGPPHPKEPTGGPAARKVKLVFHLDAAGRVAHWSVEPKPGARD